MKIEKHKTVTMQFKDVKVGQVFEYKGTVYMNCYDFTAVRHVMVDLNDGYANSAFSVLSDNTEVILYADAKVVIE